MVIDELVAVLMLLLIAMISLLVKEHNNERKKKDVKSKLSQDNHSRTPRPRTRAEADPFWGTLYNYNRRR